VLENDAEYQRWKIERRNALRTARDRKQHQRLGAELESLRQRSAAAVGPIGKNQRVADATPPSARTSTPNPTPQQPTQVRAQRRNADVPRTTRRRSFGGGGGGGAIDPISAALAILMSGSSFAAWRRRK
jgi:MprA protease rhombosortase-interaction domain-containing protein